VPLVGWRLLRGNFSHNSQSSQASSIDKNAYSYIWSYEEYDVHAILHCPLAQQIWKHSLIDYEV